MRDSFGNYFVGVEQDPYIPGDSMFGGSGSGPTQSGTGSPEGVVTADPGILYVDLSDRTLWVKLTGTGSVGWDPLTAA